MLRAREAEPIALELELYRLTYWPLYKAGHLLIAGGVADQPTRYTDWMVLLEEHEASTQRAYEQVLEKQHELTQD